MKTENTERGRERQADTEARADSLSSFGNFDAPSEHRACRPDTDSRQLVLLVVRVPVLRRADDDHAGAEVEAVSSCIIRPRSTSVCSEMPRKSPSGENNSWSVLYALRIFRSCLHVSYILPDPPPPFTLLPIP